VEFCGDGELRSACEKYGKVHGWVDPTRHYKKAKYVFASGYLTILEAQARKCLVFAAYSHPLQGDYYKLTPFSKYIVVAGSAHELLSKFDYYRKNKREAQKMIGKGYNWARKQTWESLAEQYMRLWQVKIK
jgi:hypothetical protein